MPKYKTKQDTMNKKNDHFIYKITSKILFTSIGLYFRKANRILVPFFNLFMICIRLIVEYF